MPIQRPTPTPSFAMDMEALGRENRNLNMADEDICLETVISICFMAKNRLYLMSI
jgi:hypothetical protein